MPVKIDLVTSVEQGTITQLDLFKAIDDYRDNVSLTTTPPRETVIRTESVWFKASEFLDLLRIPESLIDSADIHNKGIRIYLSVHDAEFPRPNCPVSEDYSNHLSVAILPTIDEVNVVTDLVLLPGFKSSFGKIFGECCGNMNPPPKTGRMSDEEGDQVNTHSTTT